MIEKQEVQEIFPTPLWVVDLQPAAAATLNAKLKAEIERLITPRPKIPAGSNWQTPQDLHTKPAFAEFVKLVETAARGVARFLQVDQYPMDITGCWANVNPPGSYHPMHHHPNNYLSGVYYVAVPEGGPSLVFQDPRPILMMPWTGKLSRVTANASVAQAQPGRMPRLLGLPARMSSSCACRTATIRSSASGDNRSRGASGNGSRSPGRC